VPGGRRAGKSTTDYIVLVDIGEDDYCTFEASGTVKTKRSLEYLYPVLQDVPMSPRKVTDGLSKSFMFFESAGRPDHYVKGRQIHPTQPTLEPPDPPGAFRWGDRDTYGLWGNAFGSPTDPFYCGLTTIMNCDNFSELYSFHPGGCIFLYGDGSADLVSEDIDVDAFISLFTAAAGDLNAGRN
jgi:hypothetical protein